MKFAVITDTHYVYPTGDADSHLWNKQLLSMTETLADRLVKRIRAAGVDFVIHCGDLTHDGDHASMEFAKETFSQFGCPIFIIPGNHDTAENNSRELLASWFCMKDNRSFYMELIGDLRFVFIDTAYGHLADGTETAVMKWRDKSAYRGAGPSAEQLDWLAEEFARDTIVPTIVVAHHPFAAKPAYPQRLPRLPNDLATRTRQPDKALFPIYSERLLSLVCANPNVKAVFAGHWHINDAFDVGATKFIYTSSLIEFPFEFRIVEVKGDKLSSTLMPLEGDDLSKLSLVPEWNNSWARGEEGDRVIELLLRN